MRALLERGETHARLDARFPGVHVPPGLSQREDLVLKFSHRYGVPMKINGWGIRAELAFGGTSFEVAIPWPAIDRIWCVAAEVGFTWERNLFVAPATRNKGGLRLLN